MLPTVGITKIALSTALLHKMRGLTIGQTFQYPSKEILGRLADELELVISSPFTSSLQLFRSDGKDIATVAVPERYVYVTSNADSPSANGSW
jgi:hypothetical protein